MPEHSKSCFVGLKLLSILSPPCIFCRCTSCRDDVVTMAAKPRERKARGKGWRQTVEENKSSTKSSAAGRKKTGTNKSGERRERSRGGVGVDKGRDADVCFHVAWPSNLLSSLHVAADLSRWIHCAGATWGPASVPLILCLICQFQWLQRPVTALRRPTGLRKCRSPTSWPPHTVNFIRFRTESSSEDTSLSLIGLFAGTLLNVNFAKGVRLF